MVFRCPNNAARYCVKRIVGLPGEVIEIKDGQLLINGKPLFGWPAAMPVTFELTVLLSAFATFFGMWGLNGMPKLYHPVFKSARFRRATADRFFIVLEASDPKFHLERTRDFAKGLEPDAIEILDEVAGAVPVIEHEA